MENIQVALWYIPTVAINHWFYLLSLCLPMNVVWCGSFEKIPKWITKITKNVQMDYNPTNLTYNHLSRRTLLKVKIDQFLMNLALYLLDNPWQLNATQFWRNTNNFLTLRIEKLTFCSCEMAYKTLNRIRYRLNSMFCEYLNKSR